MILTRCSWCGAPSTRRACATRARSSRPPGCAAKSRARVAARTPPRLPVRRSSNAIIPNVRGRLHDVRPSRRRAASRAVARLYDVWPSRRRAASPCLDRPLVASRQRARLPKVRAREAAVKADLAVVGKALAAACAEVREGGADDAVGGGSIGGVDEAGELRDAGEVGELRQVVPAFVASPGSTAEAAAVLRVAAEHELAVVPRGSGSRLGWGVPPSRCDLVVATLRMDAMVEHAAGDLVARVQAGARMGDVARLLAAAGQQIALDVPAGATVGGVVASGLAGPRRLRYGSPRDLLIGITVVRADGTLARAGGKVVKNVAGYDLGKLFAGSRGTLGLITQVTFRLHPLPAHVAYVAAECASPAEVARALATATEPQFNPVAAEIHWPCGSAQVQAGIALEGDPASVAARGDALAAVLGPDS